MPTPPKLDPLQDSDTPDDEVAAAFVARFGRAAPQLVAVAGDALRDLVRKVAFRERSRCLAILGGGHQAALARVKLAEDAISAAVLTGRNVDQLGFVRQREVAVAQALGVAVAAVRTPPGCCPECAGARVVPSAVVTAGGQPGMVPCPSCCAPASGAAAENPATDLSSGGG